MSSDSTPAVDPRRIDTIMALIGGLNTQIATLRRDLEKANRRIAALERAK